MNLVIKEDAAKYYKLNERLDDKAAKQIAENNKISAFGFMDKVKVWNRPTPEKITVLDGEKRYEPFWEVIAKREINYKSHSSHIIDIGNKDAHKVEINGKLHDVKDGKVQIGISEQCTNIKDYLDSIYGVDRDVSRKEIKEYIDKHMSEAIELSADEVLNDQFLIQPEKKAATIIHMAEKELAHSVKASEIESDVVTIESIILYYHPVYAFECLWSGKSSVLEVDGLTGKPIGGGRLKKELLNIAKDPDFLLDLTGDAMDIVVPGGRLPVTIFRRLMRDK